MLWIRLDRWKRTSSRRNRDRCPSWTSHSRRRSYRDSSSEEACLPAPSDIRSASLSLRYTSAQLPFLTWPDSLTCRPCSSSHSEKSFPSGTGRASQLLAKPADRLQSPARRPSTVEPATDRSSAFRCWQKRSNTDRKCSKWSLRSRAVGPSIQSNPLKYQWIAVFLPLRLHALFLRRFLRFALFLSIREAIDRYSFSKTIVSKTNTRRTLTVDDLSFFVQFIREILWRDVLHAQIHLQHQFLCLNQQTNGYALELHCGSQSVHQQWHIHHFGRFKPFQDSFDMLLRFLAERLQQMRIHVPIEREKTLVLGFIAIDQSVLWPLLRQRLPEPVESTLHLIQTFSSTAWLEKRLVVLQLVHTKRLNQSVSRLFAHRVDHIASCLQTSACYELVIESCFLFLHIFKHIFGDGLIRAFFERVHQVLHLVEIVENQRAERVAESLHSLQEHSDLNRKNWTLRHSQSLDIFRKRSWAEERLPDCAMLWCIDACPGSLLQRPETKQTFMKEFD